MLRSTLILGLGTENSLKLDLRNELEIFWWKPMLHSYIVIKL